MFTLIQRSCLAVLVTFLVSCAVTGYTQPKEEKKHFVYVLHVTPKFHDESAWTEAEKSAVSEHFTRLSKATQEGKVILAGRTTEPLDKTFGLVVFEAENEAEAKAFMEADPAVKAGVMSATLHPYALALLRKS